MTTKHVNLRLSPEMHNRLVDMAERKRRSMNGQIEVYIEQGLAADEAPAYPPRITDAPDMREALIEGLAKYILRDSRSAAQVLARAAYDLRGVAARGYTFADLTPERLAAEADEYAGRQRDTNVNWEQWAQGR